MNGKLNEMNTILSSCNQLKCIEMKNMIKPITIPSTCESLSITATNPQNILNFESLQLTHLKVENHSFQINTSIKSMVIISTKFVTSLTSMTNLQSLMMHPNCLPMKNKENFFPSSLKELTCSPFCIPSSLNVCYLRLLSINKSMVTPSHYFHQSPSKISTQYNNQYMNNYPLSFHNRNVSLCNRPICNFIDLEKYLFLTELIIDNCYDIIIKSLPQTLHQLAIRKTNFISEKVDLSYLTNLKSIEFTELTNKITFVLPCNLRKMKLLSIDCEKVKFEEFDKTKIESMTILKTKQFELFNPPSSLHHIYCDSFSYNYFKSNLYLYPQLLLN